MKHLIAPALLALLAACTTVPGAPTEIPLTAWRFVSIDAKAPVSDKAELLIFDGRLVASIGCNHLSASLELVPGKMKVGPVLSTRMHCAGLMEQERAVSELLSASPGFFIEGGRFAMVSDGHRAELVKKAER